MTDIVMDAATPAPESPPAPESTSTKCSTPGCIRPAPHEGMRHRYAPTKDLQPEPEPAPVAVPEPDRHPRYGSLDEKPYNHALSTVDDGIQVAWSHCAATNCLQHITRCQCPTGPLEPTYITRWRTKQFPIAELTLVAEPKVGRSFYMPRDQDTRAATQICDSCGELLYLLDTPDGKRAYTVSRDDNYCKVDDAGIHFARDITDADREANPDYFAPDDEDQQWAEDPDLPDQARRDTDEDDEPVVTPTHYDGPSEQAEVAGINVEPAPVETETPSNIDPEVGF